MTLLRSALTSIFAHQDGVSVVAAAGSADVTAELIATVSPTIAIVDLDGRRAAPRNALDCLAETAPECGVLTLTEMAAPPALRRALNSRARGYLSKNCSVEDLVAAVMRVAAGERFIEPGIAIAALHASRNPLTARETDVLRLAADGLSSAEIADTLFLTHGTVRNYLSVIVRKLGARSKVDAVRTAVDANWL